MALKTFDELTTEINAAVHTNQPGLGKTTAPGLNALLKSLAHELTAGGGTGAAATPPALTLDPDIPGAAASVAATLTGLADEQYQQPFVFQLTSATTGAQRLATLSLAQARQLVEGRVASLPLAAPDETTGAPGSLVVRYDATRHTLVLSDSNPGSTRYDLAHSGLLGAAPAPTFATLLGQPTDNAALAALLAAQPAATAQLALEFVFEAGFADSMGRTLGTRQAGTYASEQRQNVAGVQYQLNGAPVALPFTVASGDVLQVALTRQDTARPAVLTLLS